jgi:hypothetical protein
VRPGHSDLTEMQTGCLAERSLLPHGVFEENVQV